MMKNPDKSYSRVIATLLSASLLAGTSSSGLAANKHESNQLPEFDGKSLLIKFKQNIGKKERKSLATGLGASFKDRNNDGVDDRYRNIANGRLAMLELGNGQQVENVLSRLKNHPLIEYAEPNYIVQHTALPDDSQFSSLWGMEKIQAPVAWDSTVGDASVVVGIIDTGFDYTHPDLNANIWRNPNEIPDNDIDDDGNGYIDDVHGISALLDNGDPMDTGRHGTHVAGTIGAIGNNADGVVGVNWQTSMVGCSFLGQQGGNLADGIECINYMISLKNAGVNVRVLNNSWGGGGFAQAMVDAITAANNADLLFVAAAGNDASDNDLSAFYPANYDVANVMSIAATTSADEMSSFSQYGATTVDMGAPGSNILSTVPNASYEFFNGTSMATPHVAGAAALLLSASPDLTTAQLKSFLMNSGDPIPALDGKTVSGKRLNVANALSDSGGAGPSFYMEGAPYSATINQGMSQAYNIDLMSAGGFSGSANLTAVASPALNADISFSNATVIAGEAATMTVTTTAETIPGEYTIKVTATDGSITKTLNLVLRIWPEGTVTTHINNNEPTIILDEIAGEPTDSIITVQKDMVLTEVHASIDITHENIGDLAVKLISPTGLESLLRYREGFGPLNLVATFNVPGHELQNAIGDWTLRIEDLSTNYTGVINSWTLSLTGQAIGETDFEPSVVISSPDNLGAFLPGEMVQFSANASDTEDGDISANIEWRSNIDGLLATGTSFASSNLSVGDHTIIASVKDSANQTNSQSVTLSVANPNTTVSGSQVPALPVPEMSGYAMGEINLPTGVDIATMEVAVDIKFDSINYLKVWLVSPLGTQVILHNIGQRYSENLVETYTPVEFNGESSMGTWKLFVQDTTSYDMFGVLNSWTISVSNGDAVVPPPANTAPAVTITAPKGGSSFNQGDTVTFSGNASDAEDGDVTSSLSWSSNVDGVIGSGPTFSVSTLSAGAHTVTATASDSAALTGSSMVSLTVSSAPVNQAPTADFSFTASDLNVQFSDLSGDADGAVTNWQWDFGDNATSALANPSHSYSAAGSYLVDLTVTDDDGATSSVSKTVTVLSPEIPVPAAPTGLKASIETSGKGKGKTITNVTLDWIDNSNNETEFIVEACSLTGKGKNQSCNFSEVQRVSADSTSLTDTSFVNYEQFRVKAINAVGDSPYSNTVDITAYLKSGK